MALRMVDKQFIQDQMDELRKKMAELQPRYEWAQEFLKSGSKAKDTVAEIVMEFDHVKYPPPSVEPYHLIWRCQQLLVSLKEAHQAIAQYHSLVETRQALVVQLEGVEPAQPAEFEE